jgi:hypothetical protein
MWRRVVLVWTDISEECIASIFKVEKFAREEPAWVGSYGFTYRTDSSTDNAVDLYWGGARLEFRPGRQPALTGNLCIACMNVT